MGIRKKSLTEAVLTIYALSKNKKNVTIFHLKIIIYTAVKYCSILHGHACVMLYTLCNLSVIIISVVSPFSFEDRILVLIVPVYGHCLLSTFIMLTRLCKVDYLKS